MPLAWPPPESAWKKTLGKAVSAHQGITCLSRWEDLGRVLGKPKVICCLGNGPSSEDPDLKQLSFDALFRVNYQWLSRDFLTDPAVIFTADPDAPPAGSRAVLAFPTREDANQILRGHDAAGQPAPRRYLVFPELLSPVAARTWPARPTNGALMIAAAVALAPRRIIIAGIDLYDHPAGKYPGVADADNIYDDIHDRDVDIEVIRLTLDSFAGEVAVLGKTLQKALDRN
jgi:hypothetical protein